MKFALVMLSGLVIATGPASARKLCMDAVPEGDRFYQQCRKCEKKVSACSGELRDRMRELLRKENAR
jgi:hypothetical protein